MKTALLLLSLLTGAIALKPNALPTKATSKAVGSTAPFPEFDPLNLSTPKRENFYREAELKHGRLGMVAASTFPLIESYTHEPAINEFQKLDEMTQLGIVTSMLGVEFYSMVRGWEFPDNPDNWFKLKEDYRPGDFGFSLVKNWDSDESIDLQNKELNNGRLAMIAAAGMMAQELIYQRPLF